MLNKIAISVLYINYSYKKMKLINSPILLPQEENDFYF